MTYSEIITELNAKKRELGALKRVNGIRMAEVERKHRMAKLEERERYENERRKIHAEYNETKDVLIREIDRLRELALTERNTEINHVD